MKLQLQIDRRLLRSLLHVFFLISMSQPVVAQHNETFRRIPSEYISGRLSEVRHTDILGRLPQRLKDVVRGPVWHLGSNSAGSYVDFHTLSDTIYVRYKVTGAHSMPHMPAIGVSGVDLYYQDGSERDWHWAFGNYNFNDTIQYRFTNIGKGNSGVYRLYLPLYNSLEWIEIAGSGANDIRLATQNPLPPILVYGTSIAQGACATRPGLAWTNILGRAFQQPVINLGFSGNGRLEQPILDLMVDEGASAFILDCVPNLAITKDRSAKDLENLLIHAVKTIRQTHAEVPIVLAAHSSAHTPGFLNVHTQLEYEASSAVAEQTYRKLLRDGIEDLYWVSEKDFGLDIESTVDYAHPNDIGMMKIAEAYRDLLEKIL